MPPFFCWGIFAPPDILLRLKRFPMRFVDSTIKVFSAQAIGLVATFFTGLAISRILGPEGKGLVALILATAEILYCVSHLGHGFSVQYFLGKKEGKPLTLLANQMFYPPSVAVIVAIGFVLAYPLFSNLLQDTPLIVIYPAAILLITYMFFQPCCQYLIGIGRFNEFSTFLVIKSSLTLLFVLLALLVFSPTVDKVMWAYIAALIIVDFLTVRACLKSRAGESLKPSFAQFRTTFAYGLWIYMSSLIREVAKRVDLVLVFAIEGVGLAGVYSVATGLTAPLVIIPQAVQTVFFPKTSGQSEEDAAATTPLYHRQMILVMLAAAAGVALVSHPVLALFGPDFLAGQVPLLILLGMALFRGLIGIISLHILGRGKAYTVTIMTILVLSVAIVLNALLIPRYGAVGAAIATTTSELIHYVAWLVLYRVVVGGDVKALFAFTGEDFRLTWREGLTYLGKLRNQYFGR